MTIQDIGHDLEILDQDNRLPWGPGAWITGKLHGHLFHALAFEQHAKRADYELGRSRISKLYIRRQSDGEVVCNFDRGWDIKPPIDSEAAEIVAFLETGLVDYVPGGRGMRYEIRERQLYLDGEPAFSGDSLALHSELEFWQEIERLREKLRDANGQIQAGDMLLDEQREMIELINEQDMPLDSSLWISMRNQRDAAIAERDLLARKVAHGCTDASCVECES